MWATSKPCELHSVPGGLPPKLCVSGGHPALEGGEFTSLDAGHAAPACWWATTSALAHSFY